MRILNSNSLVHLGSRTVMFDDIKTNRYLLCIKARAKSRPLILFSLMGCATNYFGNDGLALLQKIKVAFKFLLVLY